MREKTGGIAIAGAVLLISAALVVTGAGLRAAIPPIELVSTADPNQTSATAGALMIPQVNQRTYSADGRYVVFQSSSENIIDGLSETKITANIFLYDRVANTTVLVSHAAESATTSANGDSFVPCMSADGQFVVYWTFASNVVANQNDSGDSTPDVFIFDRTTGTNTLVSHTPGAPATTGDSNSYDPTVSADGRFVTFTSSASNLVPGQTDGGGFSNIFLWDRINDTITLVSHISNDALTTSDGGPFNSVVSNDGSYVAYLSNASNVVSGQSQSTRRYQIFLWNRNTNQSVLISHNATSPTTATNGASFYPIMNADASYIVFYSAGTDLISGQVDANQDYDIFLYERATGTNTLVSHTQGSTSTTGLMRSLYPSISDDGRYVVYQSTAPDLVTNDLNNVEDVFIWDRTTNTNTLMSRSATSLVSASANAKSFGAHISGDGTTVSFTSNASDLLSGQTASGNGDIFFFDRTHSTLHLVSHTPGSSTSGGDDESFLALPSADGAFIAYNTLAGNIVPNDTNGSGDVMIYNRAPDTNTAASLRAPNLASLSANGNSGSQHASADGRFIVFVSDATNLVPNQSDGNNVNDIFIRDRQTNTTVLVSHAAGSTTKAADAVSDSPQISADGRWITYASLATDLVEGMVDLNGSANVYLYDRLNDTTTLVSHSVIGGNFTGSDASFTPALSGDGRFVAYTSYAVDLVTGQGDSNDDTDVFVFDRMTGANTLVSHDSAAASVTGLQYSFAPSISQDGKFIAYYSGATDLVPNQNNANNSVQHCFLYDRAANTNAMIDHQFGVVATSGDGNGGSTEPLDPPIFSADGLWIAYASSSTNLISGQTDMNADYDIFLFDRAAGTNLLVSHLPNDPTATGNAISYSPSVSADGRFVAYRSESSDLVTGQDDTNTFQDVFLFDRVTGTNRLVSHVFAQPAKAGNGASGEAPRYGYQSVSPDGRFVAFWSSSTDLIPNYIDRNGISGDLFLFDRLSGNNILLSHALGSESTGGNGGSGDSQHTGGPIWSADGHYLFFASRASDLISDDFNNREDVFALSLPLLPVSVVSRKAHGLAGNFDVNLPIAGTPGIECRGSGSSNDYTLVFTFPTTLTSVAGAMVSAHNPASGTGMVSDGSIGPNSNQYTVNLKNVSTAQYITVTLNNVTDTAGHNSNVLGPQMGVLVGDVNATGVVTSGDTNLCKAQALQPVTSANFRNDINASGAITTGDVNIIKQNALGQLPP
jgi:WD40-like Beta Propeller Repeat